MKEINIEVEIISYHYHVLERYICLSAKNVQKFKKTKKLFDMHSQGMNLTKNIET